MMRVSKYNNLTILVDNPIFPINVLNFLKDVNNAYENVVTIEQQTECINNNYTDFINELKNQDKKTLLIVPAYYERLLDKLRLEYNHVYVEDKHYVVDNKLSKMLKKLKLFT